MPDLKISEFEERTPLQGTEDIAAADAGLNVRFKVSTLRLFLNAAWGEYAGFIKAAERTKLSNIATAATKNRPDLELLNRENHTGSQSVSTITGLGKVATSNQYNDLDGKPAAIGLATSATAGLVALSPGMTLDPITNQLYVTRMTQRPSLDPIMKSPKITLANSDYTAAGDGTGQGTVIGTTGNFAGKWYFEVVFAAGTANVDNAVGLATLDADLDLIPGVAGPGAAIRQTTGAISVDAGAVTGNAQAFNTVSNVVRVALDAAAGRVWFAVGNAPWNGSSSANPATGAGGLVIGKRKLYPFVSVASDASFTVRFGGTMSFTTPAGYAPWATSTQAIRLADLTDVDSSGWEADLVLKFDVASGKWKALPEADYVVQATALVGQATQAAEDALAAKDGVDATVTTVQGYAAEALASKNAAASSATAAADSASAADASKTAAASSVTTAAGHATAANNSKTAAETAKTAAETARDTAVTAANSTAADVTAAELARNQAAGNATVAQSARDAAEGSATAAAGSASAALASKNAAADSATAADGSKTAAANSATGAASAKTAAETARDQAVTAANSTGDNVTAAQAARDAAAGSATAAANSATAADASKTAAAASAAAAAQSAEDAEAAGAGWQAGLAEAGIPNAKVLTGTVDWQTLDKSGYFILPSIGTNGPPVESSYFGTVLAHVEVAADGSRQIWAYLNALDSTWSAQAWTMARRPSGVWKRWEPMGGFSYRRTRSLNMGSATLAAVDRGNLLAVTPVAGNTFTLPDLNASGVNAGDAFTFYNYSGSTQLVIKPTGTNQIWYMPDGRLPRDTSNVYSVTLNPGESITLVVNDNRVNWVPLNYSKAPPAVRIPVITNGINLNTLIVPGVYSFSGSQAVHADAVGWPAGISSQDGFIEVMPSGSAALNDVFQRITFVPSTSGYKAVSYERMILNGTPTGGRQWRIVGPVSHYDLLPTANNGPVYVDEVGDVCVWDTLDSKYYKDKTYSQMITWVFSTSWMPPRWCKYARIVEMIGGGGGGGTGPNFSTGLAGAGGSGGYAGQSLTRNSSYLEITLTPGAVMDVVIGAGGAGGNDTTNGAAGNQGGLTSFAGKTVTGGQGGGKASGAYPSGMGVIGEKGWPATVTNQRGGSGGDGQPSRFGPGGTGGLGGSDSIAPLPGNVAPNYSYGAGGGGGGGSVSGVGNAKNGGNGAPGIIILEY